MPFLLPNRIACVAIFDNHVLFICCKNKVKWSSKIRTRAHVNGNFLSIRLSFVILNHSLHNMRARELYLEKLHVAKTHDRRQKAPGSLREASIFSWPFSVFLLPRDMKIIEKTVEELDWKKRQIKIWILFLFVSAGYFYIICKKSRIWNKIIIYN